MGKEGLVWVGKEEGLTLYTIFANIHSTSSTSTSTPCNCRASWNVDIGIRVDLSEAIQLFISLGSNSSLHAMPFSSRVGEASIDKISYNASELSVASSISNLCLSHLVPCRSELIPHTILSPFAGSFLALPYFHSTLATPARKTYAFLNNTLKHPSLALSTTR